MLKRRPGRPARAFGKGELKAPGLPGAGAFETPQHAVNFAADVLEASTHYSIISCELDGSIVLWNEGARRLYGYQPSDVLGKSIAMLHTEDDVERDLPREMIDSALRDGLWEGVAQRVRSDGTEFPARVVVTPRRDPESRLMGFLLVSSDISEEIQIRERLQQAVAYSRQLLESAPDAIIGIGPEGLITLTNSQVERLFGYGPTELIGKSIETLVPERFHEAHVRHRGSYFQAPRTRSMGAGLELYARRKDGSEFPCEISLSSTESPEGPIAVAAVRDVTESRRAEGMFRNLLESAPDAMVIVDGSGDIQLTNAEAERLFGYSTEDLVGRPVEMLIPDRYHGRHSDHRGKFFKHPRARPMGAGLDLWGVRRDGVEFPVEISLSPLETEEGLLAMAAIRDVTERKRVERDLKTTNSELEQANRAKDGFLANMSHELRTPLNAILGFTGTLLMELPGELNAEQRDQLETVQTNGRHLLSIINDLLDVAKIESGKVEIELAEVDCSEVVNEVVDGLRPMAEGKGLEFELAMPDQLTVNSDRRALSQILINLINNAIKFTSEGAIGLEVEREGDGSSTCFRVIDSGVGIRPEDKTRLFDAFEQGDDSTANHRGTGLGLYISRELARLIGGQLSFESEYGTGSTFTLMLPGGEAGS